MATIIGRGACCHAESVANLPGSGEASDYFPWARWVRLDDVRYDQWDISRSSSNSLNKMRARHNWYRNDSVPFMIAQDIDKTWGENGAAPNGHMVDHARDLLGLGTVDLLLLPNEPNEPIFAVDPEIYAGWVRDIQQAAVQLTPNVVIGAPQLSQWSLDPESPIRQWFATFVEYGGLSATDVVCVHPYLPNDSTDFPSSVIPEWISHPTQGILSQIRGKPLVFTEMGAIASLCISLYGSETDANMASLFLDYVQGCDGYPCALYDGVYGEAPPLDPAQDLTYWVDGEWFNPPLEQGFTVVGSTVSSTMPPP